MGCNLGYILREAQMLRVLEDVMLRKRECLDKKEEATAG
jgi:hypothetical protein